MPRRQRWECGLLVVAVALTRWIFRSRYLYDVDSVHFALGMQRFDPVVNQPHPPGYFLYISLGRLVNGLFHDANAALVAISIAASCGAAAIIYLLTSKWFGPKAATFACLIFLFSPLAWFHGTVALIYIVEAFLSALAGFLCWRVYSGREILAIPTAAILGLGAGIRPSFLLFLAPLFVFSLRKVRRGRALAALGCLLVTAVAWFIPMVEASGGLRAYFSSLLSLWRIAGGQSTVVNSPPFMSVGRLLTIGLIYGLCFGAAALLSAGVFRPQQEIARQKCVFTWIWLAPGLLFFTFVFLRLVNSGYLLVIFPPACAWLGLWASEWYARTRWPGPLKLSMVGVSAAVNILIFLKAPVYCSYNAVRGFEAELQEIQRTVPWIASPEHTLIIGFDAHFLGYRHAGYYLPGYLTAQYPEISVAGAKQVFTMLNRDTELVQTLPSGGFTRFLLFPTTSREKAHRQYMADVRAKFPSSDLETVRLGNHDFVMGPISDLRFLFPDAAPSDLVYTTHHLDKAAVYSR